MKIKYTATTLAIACTFPLTAGAAPAVPAPGESDFLIKVMNGKANSLIVYAENYGSKSAGRYRYGLQGELGNLGGSGAKVDLGLAYTKPNNWFARLDYARRIGSDELMSKEAESKGRIWFMAGKVF